MNNSIPTPGLLNSGLMSSVDFIASPVKGVVNSVKNPYNTLSKLGYFLGRKIHPEIPVDNIGEHIDPYNLDYANSLIKRKAEKWHTAGKVLGVMSSVVLSPVSITFGGVKGLITGIVKMPINFIDHYSGRAVKRALISKTLKEKSCKLFRDLDQTRLYVNYKYHGEMKSSLLKGKTEDSKIDEIIRYLTGTGKLYLRKNEVTGEIRVDSDPAMKKYAL